MKIDRAIIIRRLQVPISIEYADMCARSCDDQNLKYEYMEAIEFLQPREAFKAVGAKKQKTYINRMGNCCAHASHIKCWKRIIEIGKPCIILEHDAIVKGNVKDIHIPNMSVVTFGHRVKNIDDYNPPAPASDLVRIKRSIGCHAYAITPQSAEWLWNDTLRTGIEKGLDQYLMMMVPTALPLYVCEPPQAVCLERISTSKFSNSNDINADDRQHPIKIFSQSITNGWKKGLKSKKSG